MTLAHPKGNPVSALAPRIPAVGPDNGPLADDARSAREIAASFVSGVVTNPLMRSRSPPWSIIMTSADGT